MPPRKSNVSVVSNGDVDNSSISVAQPAQPSQPSTKSRESLGVEDLNLPRTMIQRLAKGVLPSNTQIQKDAVLALSKSATVFVNFLASSAGENAAAAGKKTIMPHDVYAALKDQEFEMLLPRVQAEVTKYNEIQSTKRNEYRRSKKAEQQPSTARPEGADGDAMDTSVVGDEIVANPHPIGFEGNSAADDANGERPLKKIRREDGEGAMDDETEDVIEVDDEEDPLDDADEEDSGEDDDVEEDEPEVEEHEAPEREEGETGGFLNGIRDEALDEPDSD